MEKLSRREQKEHTHQGLVQRAETLFASKGIAATSTADVAKALRVSHGTVFIHFATRDMLILEVVERFGDRLATALRRKLAGSLQLLDLLNAHLDVLAEHEDFYRRVITETEALPAAIRGIVFSMNAHLSYRFFELASPEMAEGKLKTMSQADFFNTWLALVHYQILNRDLLATSLPISKTNRAKIASHFMKLVQA